MPHAVRAPRGSTLSCKGWVQEAALRMLQNNLDSEVAEKSGVLNDMSVCLSTALLTGQMCWQRWWSSRSRR